MRLFLGTHHPHWLALVDVPLFVSHRRLAGYRTLPEARGPWALDSGGFTELAMHGTWVTPARAYVTAVRRYATEVGQLQWAAPQDWMCEPIMLARTGLTVADHQARTVASVLELRHQAADLPWVPVLQGWTIDDYRRCVDLYTAAGIDLTAEPVTGLGSVCRRQSTAEIEDITAAMATGGIRLHGFGVKAQGLARYGRHLVSADSLAWSYNARRNSPLPGHTHINCANCLPWALRWYQRTLARADAQQLGLWDPHHVCPGQTPAPQGPTAPEIGPTGHTAPASETPTPPPGPNADAPAHSRHPDALNAAPGAPKELPR